MTVTHGAVSDRAPSSTGYARIGKSRQRSFRQDRRKWTRGGAFGAGGSFGFSLISPSQTSFLSTAFVVDKKEVTPPKSI